jgi:predicted DNA-binding transcriptional regulator YafY
LQGFCLVINQNRIFKISRLKGIQATGEIYNQRPSNVLFSASFENSFSKQIDFQLKISSQGAYRVYDEFDEQDVVKNDDGSFTITTSFPESDWVYDYILSFGTVVEAIEPLSMREIIVTRLEMMLN